MYTRLTLESMAVGAALEILVDHEPATRNVPRSAREWGQEIEAVEAVDPGQWRIIVRKRVD